MKKILLLLFLFTIQITVAQSDTVITVMIPSEYSLGLEEALRNYSQTYNTIDIQTTEMPIEVLSPSGLIDDPDDYFDTMASLTSQADIVFVDRYTFGVEVTRTDYFLDLTPLIDINIHDQENIYPAMWDAFSWDNGTWAFPVYGSLLSLSIDRSEFDRAGLPYPTSEWTSEDYINAARSLAEGDDPGIFISELDLPFWFQALSRVSFTDSMSELTSPNLNMPELVALLSAWSDLDHENVLTTLPFQNIPLQMNRLLNIPVEFEYGPLPDNRIGLHSFGLAISKGTAHPEVAYQVASHLASSNNCSLA